MARINIEDDIFIDPRFRNLVVKVGNEDLAMGMLIRLWRLGQQYWKKGRQLIPFKTFDHANLEIMIEVNLAEKRDEGVYVCGAKDYFDWLADKVASASNGGKKSAEKRRAIEGTAVPKNASNRRSKTEAPPKQNRSTSEPSSSSSSSAVTKENSVEIQTSVTKGGSVRALTREDFPPEKNEVADDAIRETTKVVFAIRKFKQDESSARQVIGEGTWALMQLRFPDETWRQFLNWYGQKCRDGNEAFFRKDLAEHFRLFLPALKANHATAPPLAPEAS